MGARTEDTRERERERDRERERQRETERQREIIKKMNIHMLGQRRLYKRTDN